MTDEEMAEEYENAQDYCGLLDVLFEEQYNQDYGGLSSYISPYIEQAYLAGLKAGRPKDEGIVKPLKDSILRNQRLSSQEQQELCAWIECAMDFGAKL